MISIFVEPAVSVTANTLAAIQPKSSLSFAVSNASTGLVPQAQVTVVVVPPAVAAAATVVDPAASARADLDRRATASAAQDTGDCSGESVSDPIGFATASSAVVTGAIATGADVTVRATADTDGIERAAAGVAEKIVVASGAVRTRSTAAEPATTGAGTFTWTVVWADPAAPSPVLAAFAAGCATRAPRRTPT